MSNVGGITIVGAGLAGLIAAHAWPSARLIEAAPKPAPGHRALLRFRSDAVSQLTGIEFRKVRVRKGIWSSGKFVEPSIAAANGYTLKTAGRLLPERSIWSVEPVDRFIAPDNFYEQLLEAVGPRVTWGAAHDFAAPVVRGHAVVSTAPLPIVIEQVRPLRPDAFALDAGLNFTPAPIVVRRYKLEGADVFQTVYFPDADTPIYRASITGDTLIVESVGDKFESGLDITPVIKAFCLQKQPGDIRMSEKVSQRLGKIAPIPDVARKELIWTLTHHFGIYSLGRFATWRNILLDDVVSDIVVVKRLMKASAYDLRRAAS